MSSATTKNSEIALGSQKPIFEDHRCEIMESVSHALHQLAQPMTVLQGVLELALIEPCTEEQYRHSLERAIDQWQRVAASIDSIRQLVHLRPCPRSAESFPAAAGTPGTEETTKAPRRSPRV